MQTRRNFLIKASSVAMAASVALTSPDRAAAEAGVSGQQVAGFNPKGEAVTAPTQFIQT